MQGFRGAITRVRTPILSTQRIRPSFGTSRRAPSAHQSQQLLQFQNASLPLSFPRFYSPSFQFLGENPSMSSNTQPSSSEPTDPNITKILNFWFHDHAKQDWFQPADGPAFDKLISDNFKSLVEEARDTDKLDWWASSPQGALAMVLLLDQFPRNIYRLPSPDAHFSFASDAKALRVATEAIANEFDKQIPSQPECTFFHRLFFYMPFMHAEDLLAQVAGVALFENLKSDCPEDSEAGEFAGFSIGFSKKHLRCVQHLGRFPKRNEALKRESTQKDKEWLEKYPEGF